MNFQPNTTNSNSAVGRLQQKIATLEGAIKQIVATKKHLQQNAQEVKTEIHASVSRQLESLRNREVYLLSQVELIQQAKEEILRQQEDSLNQALGGLQNYVDCPDHELETDNHTSLSKQLSASLDRLDDLALTPEETPYLTFHANPVHLRESIHKFGELDARHLPLQPFADPEMTSSSLPQAFEDYDDEDHLVLFKPVSQAPANTARVNKRTVTVSIPKMSERPHEWLFIPPEAKLTPVPSCNELKFPPFKTNLKEWMTRHACDKNSVKSSSSIHQWLREIQSEADIEDGDFDVISPTMKNFADSPFSEICTAVPKAAESIPIKAHFQRVLGEPLANWLLADEKVRAACEFGADYPYETMKYFRDVNQDTKHWLLDYQTKKQNETACCRGSCSPSTPPSMDIENLDRIACVHPTTSPTFKYFSEISKQPADWLLTQDVVMEDDCATSESSWTRISGDTDRDVEEKGCGEEFDITDVCRANEPCKTFTECVCDDNCCMSLMAKNSPAESVENIWLAQQNASTTTDVEFKYFESVSGSPSNWLSKSTARLVPAPNNLPEFSPFATPQTRQSEWLAPLRVNAPYTCPTFSIFKQASSQRDVFDQVLSPLTNIGGGEKVFGTVDFTHKADDCDQWLSSKPVKDTASNQLNYEEDNPWLLKKKALSANIGDSGSLEKVLENFHITAGALNWINTPTLPSKEACQPSSKELELPELSADKLVAEELFACFRKTAKDNSNWLFNGE